MGEWDWHDLALLMRPPTLIPRPETEELVELILADLNTQLNHHQQQQEELWFLDIGSGSGAIGLALLNKLPRAHCCACDISAEAVQLSLDNAAKVSIGTQSSTVLRYTCQLCARSNV